MNVSILANQTNSDVLNKQIRKPFDFSDLAINKIRCIPKETQKQCNYENTGAICGISKQDLDNKIFVTERLNKKDGPQFVLETLKSLIVNTNGIILCNPKFTTKRIC